MHPLLILATTITLPIFLANTLSAQSKTEFSAPADQAVAWEQELPPNFLATFEFKQENAAAQAAISYDEQLVLDLPAKTDWQRVQLAINSDNNVYSSWLDDKPLADEKPLATQPSKTNTAGQPRWNSTADEADENFQLSAEFTLAASFRTTDNGTIVSKCAPQGEWTPNSKALFIAGGRLVYDIGWKGAIQGKTNVTDGNWHHVVLVYRKSTALMYLDGKLEAKDDAFTAPDPKGSVLKIGHAAENFGGDYSGDIGFVRFWKRPLPKAEIEALGKGEESKTNTPLLNWQQPTAPASATTPPPPNQQLKFLAKTGNIAFRNVQIKPLAEVDHARLIRNWDELSLARGARIYNGLCITCHGDQTIDGTLPTALRFHSGEFKNGKDPLSMYNTLSKGYNLMVAQPWMTPTQKYDVIHYIRESLIKEDNPSQLVPIDDTYLASLPRGIGVGPTQATLFADNDVPKHKKMDFGPVLFWTLEVGKDNIAYKGIAIRLDEGAGGISKGHKWILYDHDTMRVAAAWTGDEFVNWRGIAFDQSHGSHTGIVGDIAFVNPVGPGWANPSDGSFEDTRFLGRDDKPYGPLPRDWTHYEGLYLHGNRAVIHYTVGDAVVHELPGYEMQGDTTIFSRNLNIGASANELKLRIAPATTSVTVIGGGSLAAENGFHVLTIPPRSANLAVKVLVSEADDQAGLEQHTQAHSGKPIQLESLMNGGEKRWPDTILTSGKTGDDSQTFAVDEIELPWDDRSPWNSWMRIGGFDFFADGKRAAVATWLGDVWIVDGLGGTFSQHRWQRIATGLFQPLGVKIVDDTIFVSCRDQIAELHDLNADGEIDYVRNFNNDHQVTEHFHEFAMGLQRDAEGNFYYAKSARHAKTALVPHHGTLLKVSADGSNTEIIATGFRAANGVCLNPDGTFIVTDQEGHWNPKNRINWVKKGGFYGNMFGYHDVTDEADNAMEQPLCWITNSFDRSPGELMWVPESAQWGDLNGSLLNLSYGTGEIFLVPHQHLKNGQVQGGMISLGLKFPTGIMRGRFHPQEGQLYAIGMFAWAGNQQQDGGFYRIRKTEQPCILPIGLHVVENGIILNFATTLDPTTATQLKSYQVKTWGLKRTKNYGSAHFDEKELRIDHIELLDGGNSVLIKLPELKPTWCMEIKYELKTSAGQPFNGNINNTIHSTETQN